MTFTFSKKQWRIFLICFLCYTAAYIARLNLSAALGSLMADRHLTDAQGGMMQTVFALIYAAGQLVNGSLVDKISARIYIFCGLLLSGVCNLLFGLAGSYGMLVLLWGLNGAAQSMLWTPIIKLMAAWFRGKRRSGVSFGLSMTLILGNLAAWALSGCLAAAFGWRLSFIIPACVVAGAAFAALFGLSDRPEPGDDLGDEEDGAAQSQPAAHGMSLGDMLKKSGLVLILACCVCNGFVRDGIITWAPTIIAKLGDSATAGSALTSLIIPLLNLLGVLLARRCYVLFGNNARRCSGCLMGLSAILALLLQPFGGSMIGCALVLGLCCSATYGINPMLTTLIPMEYERVGRVGLVAGMSDCFIYLGSAMAGVVTGAISDACGWTVVFVLWCGVAVAGLIFAFSSMRGGARLRDWGDRA